MQLINLKLQPQAIHQIAQWHFDEWHALFPERTLADFAAELTESMHSHTIPQTWLLLDEQQNVCGTGSLLLQDMNTNQHLSPWLANIFLLPECRGRGLGRALVQQLMQEASQLGVTVLYLFTEDQQSFYEKLGWQLHHRELYEGEWVSVMLWILEPKENGN
jgi:N-acetylglutamate synthase-like GNAT family acetyltransferase